MHLGSVVTFPTAFPFEVKVFSCIHPPSVPNDRSYWNEQNTNEKSEVQKVLGPNCTAIRVV